MSKILYFAYGSNMSISRLESRLSSVRKVTTARLNNHKLRFHKKSHDGSGKCDAVAVSNIDDVVYGVVFEMTISQKRLLDEYEDLGNGYEQKEGSVFTRNGEMLMVLYYYATTVDSSLKPYGWYKKHVLQGAYENRLPSDYIRSIESINTKSDMNIKRQESELSIYS